jgi:hypothetical protein
MNNLYIFAIGGSGERVMHSFIMLLAGGLKLNISGSVKPVFIDTDATSFALTQCEELIKEYRIIHDNLVDSTFCNAGRDTIGGIGEQMFTQTVDDPINLVVPGGAAMNTLNNLITNNGTENLSDNGKAELDMLYERKLLNMPLNYGFVGVPAIGSIALNYLLNGAGAEGVIQAIAPDDGIFIIGSIFGGTGAAGLPLLLNKIALDKGQNINQYFVGALSILPYFKFSDVNPIAPPANMQRYFSMLDASSFDAKTKAALHYYNNHIKNISSIYYMGLPDTFRSTVIKGIGGTDQNQDFDYFETIAAESIFNFADTSTYVTPSPNYYMYNIKENNIHAPRAANSYNLGDIPDVNVKKALIRLEMTRYIISKLIPGYISSNNLGWTINSGLQGNLNIFNNYFNIFFNKYDNWKQGLSSPSHGLPMKYANDNLMDSAETVVTTAFNPSIAQTCTEGGFHLHHHKVIIDPRIVNNMTASLNGHNYNADDIKRRCQAAFYSVSYSIEKLFNNNITNL